MPLSAPPPPPNPGITKAVVPGLNSPRLPLPCVFFDLGAGAAVRVCRGWPDPGSAGAGSEGGRAVSDQVVLDASSPACCQRLGS